MTKKEKPKLTPFAGKIQNRTEKHRPQTSAKYLLQTGSFNRDVHL
jgi:hypothetical protein